MQIKIDRRARRLAGGLLTLESRAATGCMVTRRLDVSAGKPEEPGEYEQVQVGDVTVFVRGLLEAPDGSLLPSAGAIPPRVRVIEVDGEISAIAR